MIYLRMITDEIISTNKLVMIPIILNSVRNGASIIICRQSPNDSRSSTFLAVQNPVIAMVPKQIPAAENPTIMNTANNWREIFLY